MSEELYKDKLIALCEGLEVENIIELLDQDVKYFRYLGEVMSRIIKDKRQEI